MAHFLPSNFLKKFYVKLAMVKFPRIFRDSCQHRCIKGKNGISCLLHLIKWALSLEELPGLLRRLFVMLLLLVIHIYRQSFWELENLIQVDFKLTPYFSFGHVSHVYRLELSVLQMLLMSLEWLTLSNIVLMHTGNWFDPENTVFYNSKQSLWE